MARGELMKKLIASYGRDEQFRAVAEQIISEEEKKNNLVLARALRKSLEGASNRRDRPRSLASVIPFPDAAQDFVERIEPGRGRSAIVLTDENDKILSGLVTEFRRSDEILRHGLPVHSKLLLCGPPGCGKSLCAEVFARELGIPLFVVKIDRLISSYLGETASNVRKIFEFARKQPCVLFLDEFDALARSRVDDGEHNELRRVVNSLLIFIDRIRPKGFLVAATNLEGSLDSAVWRRFDEVMWLDPPDQDAIERHLTMMFANACTSFSLHTHAGSLVGCTHAEIERICVQAMKSAVLERRKKVQVQDLKDAIAAERRRRDRIAGK